MLRCLACDPDGEGEAEVFDSPVYRAQWATQHTVNSGGHTYWDVFDVRE